MAKDGKLLVSFLLILFSSIMILRRIIDVWNRLIYAYLLIAASLPAFTHQIIILISLEKAKKAAAALKKGSGRKSTRVHTKVHFYRPKTLRLPRNPKILEKAAIKTSAAKAFDVIKYPLTTEAAMKKLEESNTLVFIVSLTANKIQIKNAMKKLYDIQAEKVNTLIR
jgi:large subunit ribosomal protein L23Ae